MRLDHESNPQFAQFNFQFSLRTIFQFVVCFGFYFAWLMYFGWPDPYILHPGILGMAAIVVIALGGAPLQVTKHCSPYDIVILGWMIVGANWCEGMRVAVFSADTSSGDVGDLLRLTWRYIPGITLSSVTLPLFCTLPIVIDLTVRRRAKPSPMTAWLMLALVVLFADAAIYLFALRGLAAV